MFEFTLFLVEYWLDLRPEWLRCQHNVSARLRLATRTNLQRREPARRLKKVDTYTVFLRECPSYATVFSHMNDAVYKKFTSSIGARAMRMSFA